MATRVGSSSTVIDVDADPEHVALEGDQHDHPFRHADFVRWLLGGTLASIAVVFAVNWYVDPTGVTGRSTRWLVAENSEVRSAKLDLYEEAVERGAEPEVLLLGSSRTMKVQPTTIEELTGARAFNAAVSGGVPRDAWLFVKLVEERQGDAFPHLVWGLDADAFRDKQLRAGLSTDPRMSRFVPRGERVATAIASAGTLTELQTLKATVRSVANGGTDDEPGRPGKFRPDGFQRWSLPLGRTEAERERRIRSQIAMYAGFIFERDAYTEVEQEPVDEFVDAVRIANRLGDVPTVFLTPYHPLAQRLLARYEMDERVDEVRRTLRELQRDEDVRFEFVDLADLDSFGGDPTQFYDGIHMTPKNTDALVRELHDRGVLAPVR